MPTVVYEEPDEPTETLFDAEGRPLRRLQWDERNHFAIITRMHGR